MVFDAADRASVALAPGRQSPRRRLPTSRSTRAVAGRKRADNAGRRRADQRPLPRLNNDVTNETAPGMSGTLEISQCGRSQRTLPRDRTIGVAVLRQRRGRERHAVVRRQASNRARKLVSHTAARWSSQRFGALLTHRFGRDDVECRQRSPLVDSGIRSCRIHSNTRSGNTTGDNARSTCAVHHRFSAAFDMRHRWCS